MSNENKKIRNRKRIQADILTKQNKISALKSEIVNLVREDYLLCDKKQWFTEEYEEHEISSRPKKKETFLVGRIHWKEAFRDDDTGKSFLIERSCAVRVNGEWK